MQIPGQFYVQINTLLYDTGPLYSPEANAGLRVVLPFLRAAGVGAIDALIVSHRDKDHAGGLAAVQAALPVRRLLTSINDLQGEPCVSGQHWEWDGVRFTMLHPLADDFHQPAKKPNNLSCVLRVETAAGSVLLTGDIEAADERALLARWPEGLRSSVLVVPHHGGSGSSSAEFVAAVAAREAVYSVGYRNAFHHPRPEVLARHAASRAWRTDQHGAIRLVLAGEPLVSAWRQERKRYWYGL